MDEESQDKSQEKEKEETGSKTNLTSSKNCKTPPLTRTRASSSTLTSAAPKALTSSGFVTSSVKMTSPRGRRTPSEAAFPASSTSKTANRKKIYTKNGNQTKVKPLGNPTTIIIADESMAEVTDIPEDTEIHVVPGANISNMTTILQGLTGLNELTRNIIITGGKNNLGRKDPQKNTYLLRQEIKEPTACPDRNVFFLASATEGTERINNNARNSLQGKYIPTTLPLVGHGNSTHRYTTFFNNIKQHLDQSNYGYTRNTKNIKNALQQYKRN